MQRACKVAVIPHFRGLAHVLEYRKTHRGLKKSRKKPTLGCVMAKGRPRKPTEELKLAGAFNRNPGRYADRASEPDPDPIDPTVPAHLDEATAACWVEIMGVIPAGVARTSDAIALEEFAHVLKICRESEYRNHTMLIRLEALISRFGLSPADRSRVSAPPAKPESKFKVVG